MPKLSLPFIFVSVFVSIAAIAAAGYVICSRSGCGFLGTKQTANSFEECVAMGNKVNASLPQECITDDGKIFIEVLDSYTIMPSSKISQPINSSGEIVVKSPCFLGGCSNQVCTDRSDIITTCEMRPEYECYRGATCERQPSGACGWTPTPELITCVNEKRSQKNVQIF